MELECSRKEFSFLYCYLHLLLNCRLYFWENNQCLGSSFLFSSKQPQFTETGGLQPDLVPRAGWIMRDLIALYGIYILYSGFVASLMETPREKVLKYLIVSGILAVVLIAGVEIILRTLFTVWGVLRVA
jgi:hypothetical protein